MLSNTYHIAVSSSSLRQNTWLILIALLHFLLLLIMSSVFTHFYVAFLSILLSYAICFYLSWSQRQLPYTLIIDEQGELTYHGFISFYGELLPKSLDCFVCVYWRIKRSDNNMEVPLIIWRDATKSEDFSRLRRITGLIKR